MLFFMLFSLLATPRAHSAPKTLLVLGDSLSAEYGIARGAGWVALLERKMLSDGMRVTIVNASISGETTVGGRNRLPALLRQHKPAIIIVELGGNDGLRGIPLATIRENLRAILLSARRSGAKVLLVGMKLPPNYGADYGGGFAVMYASLAKEAGASLVPFMLEGIADQPHFFLPDGVHPTAEAQPFILNNVWPHLNPLLKKR